jgi:hypothetical protein
VNPIRFVESTNVISPFRRNDEDEVMPPTIEMGEIPEELIPENMRAFAQPETSATHEGALVDVRLHAVQEETKEISLEKPHEVEQSQVAPTNVEAVVSQEPAEEKEESPVAENDKQEVTFQEETPVNAAETVVE